jgi:hypothetical protein
VRAKKGKEFAGANVEIEVRDRQRAVWKRFADTVQREQ